jgi:hypothetical protein
MIPVGRRGRPIAAESAGAVTRAHEPNRVPEHGSAIMTPSIARPIYRAYYDACDPGHATSAGRYVT